MRRRVVAGIVATAVVLALWADPPAPTHQPPAVCTEDMACWDCEEMGNRLCGKVLP